MTIFDPTESTWLFIFQAAWAHYRPILSELVIHARVSSSVLQFDWIVWNGRVRVSSSAGWGRSWSRGSQGEILKPFPQVSDQISDTFHSQTVEPGMKEEGEERKKNQVEMLFVIFCLAEDADTPGIGKGEVSHGKSEGDK